MYLNIDSDVVRVPNISETNMSYFALPSCDAPFFTSFTVYDFLAASGYSFCCTCSSDVFASCTIVELTSTPVTCFAPCKRHRPLSMPVPTP